MPALSDWAPDGVPFTVAEKPWPVDGLGNHRVIVRVTKTGDFVRALVPWRRKDRSFASKAVIVTPLGQPKRILASETVREDSDSADLIFSPDAGPGLYACYYLPFKFDLSEGGTNTTYLPPTTRPELPADSKVQTEWQSLPEAKAIRFEARTAFDSFAPMELPATSHEMESLFSLAPAKYLVFPEVRTRPIKMFDRLPARWTKEPPAKTFVGQAQPNEYYVFQLGVYAREQSLQNIKLEFRDLSGHKGRIDRSRFTCFNLEGTNWNGQPMRKRVDIPVGKVQPLWIGIDIPRNKVHEHFKGSVRVVPSNAKPTEIGIDLQVAGNVLDDRGDSDLWRYARLRWLNSRLGESNIPIAPYTPVKVKGVNLSVLGRDMTLGANGLPSSIHAKGKSILSGSIQLLVNSHPVQGKSTTSWTDHSEGRTAWQAKTQSNEMIQSVRGDLEFDGHSSFDITLVPTRNQSISDVELVVPYSKEASKYFMGIGHGGGNVPDRYSWNWGGPFDSWWLGGVQLGLHVELGGSTYNGPLLNLYHPAPPESWGNGGKGSVLVETIGGLSKVHAHTGPMLLKAGTPVHFLFNTLITPVKSIDTSWQFRTRFYHNGVDYAPVKAAVDAGANVVNVHHANAINPYINYPFREVGKLTQFIDGQHAQGRKVKIYDTIRELSNYTAEIWPLLSLNGEVFERGDGGGFAWLQEHVETGYIPSWYHPYRDSGTADASLVTTGFSRWINYYIEGLAWLAKNTHMDGLYLDDVSFDRRVLKRMRRVLKLGGREPLVDLHSNTGFSIGPANQYAEFFPYTDRLWFGESFDYNHMPPDQWLVETSGIPFGLMGEMLQGGGNRWLGMVYGMTTRFGWTNYEVANNPDQIWKFWDQVGIDKSEMIGYWNESCPVRTRDENVKATVYRRKGQTLISIGNFGSKAESTLLDIDWKQIGIDPKTARMEAPLIKYFQEKRYFKVDQPIPIEPKRGWLILISSR